MLAFVGICFYNSSISSIHPQLNMNRFFMYVDPTEYDMTQEGLMKACLAEVIAEAKDTGDYPMYGEEMLLQSAKWKMEDILNDISQLVEAHL